MLRFEETLDRLAREWWIFQLRRGHRYATDDLIVAWTAVHARPDARTLLDLGAGVGAVGLLTLGQLSPEARAVSVEVQTISAALARRTALYNGLRDRLEVRQVDLRQPTALGPDEQFDLITANPPFLPPGSATPSPVPQRAAARLELHGDIFDYAAVAAAHLAPGGRFCFCHALRDPRPPRAIMAADLRILQVRELLFREERPFGLAVYTCGRDGPALGPTPTLTVRNAEGQRTEAWSDVRRALQIEEGGDRTPMWKVPPGVSVSTARPVPVAHNTTPPDGQTAEGRVGVIDPPRLD